MKKSILICITFCLLSCKDSITPLESKVSMNLYGQNNKLLTKNYLTVEKVSKNSYDSVVIYNKEKIVLNYNMKINSEGILKSCNSKFLKTYSFDTISIINNRCIEPFYIAQSTKLINRKSYYIDGNEYIIYHYNEQLGGDKSFDGYYLKDVGFICYYNFDTDNYIIVDDLIGSKYNYKKIKMELINDSTFFARHTMTKLFPNYYRIQTNSNTFW